MSYPTDKNYDDILYLPHHQSTKHPPMPLVNRAAQFAAFAALKDYDAAVSETSRLTREKIELSEDEKSALNEKLLLLMENLEKQLMVEIVSYVPDARKTGGSYETQSGTVKCIDPQRRVLVLENGNEILIDDIYSIQFVQGISKRKPSA